MIENTYLGDSVYAHDDGYHIVLSTEGNAIYLNSSVFDEFLQFIERSRNLKITVKAKAERES